MFNIINSAALFRLWIIDELEGVPWCIGYQSEGCTNYIHFALQGVPHRRSTTMLFCYVSLYRSVPLVCSMSRLC
jgi:hypothetical protein